MTRFGKWSIGTRRTAQFAIAGALLLAALFTLLHRSQEGKWPVVQGTIQDTRVVADHAFETKWGGQLTWKAEFMLAYSVEGLEYAVWADSGIRGESESAVRLV